MKNNITFSECVGLLETLEVVPVGCERVFINNCVGRVLYESILARENNPKFHTSNMDGYAFRFADLWILRENGLKIASVNKAGNAESCVIQKGECIKTFTGAKMPQNADCLVIVESVEVKNGRIFLMDNLKNPSLRGRQPEAIQKSKIDCHDSASQNLAMTVNYEKSRYCEGNSPKQSAGFTKETSASPCFANEVKQPSKTNRHIERSEISKGRESKKMGESRIEKRIKADSLQVRDSQNTQSLPDRLPRLDCVKSRNDAVERIKSSLRGESQDTPKQSKSSDLKRQNESRIEKRINADSLQISDSQKAQILHNRLPRLDCVKSRNDDFGVDCLDLTIAKSRNDEAGSDFIADSRPNFIKKYQHIRKAGENYKQGDILLSQGDILTPFSIGILAQNHNILISVYRRIRVGVLSGGDELIELGELPQSQNYIYSSNNHALCAITKALGAECKIYPLLQDNPQSIRTALESALRDNDIIITTGGMSKGDFDFTKDIIREFGECVFSGVKIKPGKVVAHIKCGGAFSGKHIFALPGNPSSSIVSFLLFGRLIMQKMLNLPLQIPIKKGKLLCAVDNMKNDRLCFELADLRIESGFYAVNPRQNRNSYMINDFSGAFCILEQKSYAKGEFVDIILLNDLLKL